MSASSAEQKVNDAEMNGEVRISFPEKYMDERRLRILYSSPSKLFPLQTELAAQIGVHASVLFLPILAALALVLIPLNILRRVTKQFLHGRSKKENVNDCYARDNKWMETRKKWCGFPHEYEVGITFFVRGNKVAPPGEGYDPNKPTLLYVHGWERGTTCRGMRETFNWKSNYEFAGFSDAVDIDACDFWIDKGYNLAIFVSFHSFFFLPSTFESNFSPTVLEPDI